MGKVPCEFWADQPSFSFAGEELRQGSFQPGPAQDGASSMDLAAPDVIWHIYSHLYSSSRDGGRDLLSSGEAAPTMGKVHNCEFQADWPTFIFQPVAPDVIWHIYSSQRHFKGVLGIDLLSSGDVTLTMGQVACDFQADQPTFRGSILPDSLFTGLGPWQTPQG